METKTLYFATKNAKLVDTGMPIAILSLPAGFTCPGALTCLSMSDRIIGKITDGPKTVFRCYATSAECLFPNIRASRWNNFELLKKAKTIAGMAMLIECSLPPKTKICRLHQSGDFFSQVYFDAWLQVAKNNPDVIFYGYTKALPFWVKRLNSIPSNFHLVASLGGKYDSLICQYNLRSVLVVYTEQEAEKYNLPIDHDDTHVWNYKGNFAILLHGTQPKGSIAAKAWHQIKTKGRGGYKAEYFAHYKKTK